MRRKEIVRYIVNKVNEKSTKQVRPLTYRDVDDVLIALRDCMVECICEGEEFIIPNMFQLDMDVREVKGKRDPRTDEPIPVREKIKCKIKWCYSFDYLIKHLEVTKEMRKNILKRKAEDN